MASRAQYELQDGQTAVTEKQRQRIRYLRGKQRTEVEEKELAEMAKYKDICEKRRADAMATKITKASAEQHTATIHAVNQHTSAQLQAQIGSLRNDMLNLAIGSKNSSQLPLAISDAIGSASSSQLQLAPDGVNAAAVEEGVQPAAVEPATVEAAADVQLDDVNAAAQVFRASSKLVAGLPWSSGNLVVGGGQRIGTLSVILYSLDSSVILATSFR